MGSDRKWYQMAVKLNFMDQVKIVRPGIGVAGPRIRNYHETMRP